MTGIQSPSSQSQGSTYGGWPSALLLPAAATTVVYTPMILSRPDLWDDLPGFIGPTCFAVLILAAPVTAALVNRRWPVATTTTRACLLGLPQLPLAIVLMRLDIWLDVRSGYLLAGSGEVEMALGWGTMMATGKRIRRAVLRRKDPAAYPCLPAWSEESALSGRSGRGPPRMGLSSSPRSMLSSTRGS
jgi:hypothetical protein